MIFGARKYILPLGIRCSYRYVSEARQSSLFQIFINSFTWFNIPYYFFFACVGRWMINYIDEQSFICIIRNINNYIRRTSDEKQNH